jgi:hypothetical protein
MDLFLELEIVYIVIGIFILTITAIVTSRDFVANKEIKDKNGDVVKTVKTHSFIKGMSSVGLFVAIMIGLHYNVTTTRMDNVEEMFTNGQTIICENKMRRTISRSILLSQKLGWRVENHLFKNADYERDFHTSRCIEWTEVDQDLKEKTNDRFTIKEEKK